MTSKKITPEFRLQLQLLLQNSRFNNYLSYRETDEFQAENTRFFTCTINGRIPKKLELEFEEFKESVFDLGVNLFGEKSFETVNSIFEISFGNAVGEKYNPIDAFDEAGKKTSIAHSLGSVLFIDFWATWCKFCQEPMQENINLLKVYPELSEKLKINIVGVSTDEDQKKWSEHIQAKNWGSIPHFLKANIIKTLNITGIPYVMVIGTDGILKYEGHPRNINLKETLVNLSQGREISFSSENWDTEGNRNYDWNEKFDFEKKAEMVKQCNQSLRLAGAQKAEFIAYTKALMDKSGKLKRKTQFFVQGEVLSCENEVIDALVPKLREEFGIEVLQKKVKVITINITDEDF